MPDRQRMLCVVLLAACSLQVTTVSAMTVRDYVKQRDSADVAGSKLLRAYISGVGVGFIWANSARQAEKLQPLFCLPEKYSGGTDFEPLLDDEIGQEYVERTDAIELLILKGLRRTMPCGPQVAEPDQ